MPVMARTTYLVMARNACLAMARTTYLVMARNTCLAMARTTYLVMARLVRATYPGIVLA
jgi:hypothetical protein